MFHGSSTARSERAAAAFAACFTVAITVLAHMTADGDPARAATLAIVVVLIAVMRLRSAGRHGIILSCLSGAVVAQPTLHAVAQLLPTGTAAHDPADLGHAATDVSVSGVHLLIAALLVTAVVGAEQAFLLLLAALQPFTRWLRLLTSAIEPPSPARPRVASPMGLVFSWFSTPQVLRRGPPAVSRVAA